MGRFTVLLHDLTGVGERGAATIVMLGAVAIGVPLVAGLLRSARLLGAALAARALPLADARKIDFAAAPRRALMAALQLAIVLLVGAPLVVVTQFFLPVVPGLLVLVAAALGFGVAFWRSAQNLQGHAMAGAQVIVSAMAQQLHRPDSGQRADEDAPLALMLARIRETLPGLGEPVPVRLTERSAAANRSLADLNIRGLTGATVLAVGRGEQQIVVPSGAEVLRPGDLVALAGTGDAIMSARRLLESGPDLEEDEPERRAFAPDPGRPESWAP
jgi:CPA2 family monovalent cation:H+ antiporter-2